MRSKKKTREKLTFFWVGWIIWKMGVLNQRAPRWFWAFVSILKQRRSKKLSRSVKRWSISFKKLSLNPQIVKQKHFGMFMRTKKFKKWSDFGLKELKEGYKDCNVIKNIQEIEKFNLSGLEMGSFVVWIRLGRSLR